MARIVRFRDLEPSWGTKQAKEPGFMRWLVTWLGGPARHINTTPGTAIETTHCAVGMMYCTYIPEGCPHGVRNCGTEDVVLIWAHDGVERNGTAVYYGDDHRFNDAPPIELVRFADLEPDWSEPGARTPGTMRWSVNWVGGLAGSRNHSKAAVANGRIAIGMTVLEPGHTHPAEAMAVSRLYLVAGGEAIIDIGSGTTALGRLDGLHVPAGDLVALRNNGPGSLRLLWVDAAG